MPRIKKGTQPVTAPSGGPIGQRQQLETAQEAIPLPERRGGSPGGQEPGGPILPVNRLDVFGPTGRPDEPLTAGAPAGAGPGQLGMLPPDDVQFLRSVQMTFPSPGLRRLIAFHDAQTNSGQLGPGPEQGLDQRPEQGLGLGQGGIDATTVP